LIFAKFLKQKISVGICDHQCAGKNFLFYKSDYNWTRVHTWGRYDQSVPCPYAHLKNCLKTPFIYLKCGRSLRRTSNEQKMMPV